MRWYFAIDEAGGLGQTGDDAKRAVLTAAAHGGLEPRLLYYGNPTNFTEWMTQHNVEIINTEPTFLPALRAAEAAGAYKSHSIGHWLRVAIPQVEQEQKFVLYTDCDVIFLRPHNWAAIQPRLFAAAPEFQMDNWNYFNSGVMILNVDAMRKTYDAFAAHITTRLATTYNYDDQWALNEVYRGHWDQLDPLCNYKPYWPHHQKAALLHFHGPKLAAIEAIATNNWPLDNPTSTQLANMLNAHINSYIAWSNTLTDALQSIDFPTSLRYARLSTTLHHHQKKIPPHPDTTYLTFKMFKD